ncbi:MAG: histidinol-phosphate transaminase [Dysgonamonadaceae bacterium]|jgi:histidinol-phosphate aminotransferase|nr:histidinol-phosphate transaminase [Dysgonamonadaceae bacterium]
MSQIKAKDNIVNLQRRYIKRDVATDREYIQMDRNENPFGYSPGVPIAIEKAYKRLSRYPDIYAGKLVGKLAAIHRIAGENIVTGNGLFELIGVIPQIFLNPGDEVITSASSFDWYRIASSIANANVIEVPLGEDYGISLKNIRKAITGKTRLIWLCNPNNPTGTVIAESEIRELLENISPDILVVLDEAYIDFVREVPPVNSIGLVKKYGNVALLRTFSKVYGPASFRIGYMIACESVTNAMRNFKTPMSTNSWAVEAALASLEDRDFYRYTLEQTALQLDYFYREFDRLGFPYIRSNANFLLVHVLQDSEGVVSVLKNQGILVRGGREFGFPERLRITVGKEEDNALLIKILKEYRVQFKLSQG